MYANTKDNLGKMDGRNIEHVNLAGHRTRRKQDAELEAHCVEWLKSRGIRVSGMREQINASVKAARHTR